MNPARPAQECRIIAPSFFPKDTASRAGPSQSAGVRLGVIGGYGWGTERRGPTSGTRKPDSKCCPVALRFFQATRFESGGENCAAGAASVGQEPSRLEPEVRAAGGALSEGADEHRRQKRLDEDRSRDDAQDVRRVVPEEERYLGREAQPGQRHRRFHDRPPDRKLP